MAGLIQYLQAERTTLLKGRVVLLCAVSHPYVGAPTQEVLNGAGVKEVQMLSGLFMMMLV